ncbi:MAG: protein kinase, partial [Steroidobacteraceae bacterium]
MRLLVIAARADYRLLVKKHVEIEWPDANLVEHRLGEDNPLEAQFAATGFDAVIIVGSPPTETAEALALGFLDKAEFAPIVLLLLQDAPDPEPAAVRGLHRLYGRKIDRDRLIRAIMTASREHKQTLSMLRAHPDFESRYKFGSVKIRGHRCIRQVGSGGMCTIYLAESERAGTLVVLKVFNQVPDVSERIVGFDRFLQEYEIVAGLKHQNIVRIYDLGIADDHAYIAMEHFPAGDLRHRMKAPLSPQAALQYL